MRISQSRIYSFAQTNSYNIGKQLDKYSQQLSSGQKISESYEDPTTFVKTLKLNEDLTKLQQYNNNADSALAFASYTDSALNSFTDGLEGFKTKVLAYANSVHSSTSREALLNELDALKDNLKGIANTKVDGKYLFSGTDFDTPPIGATDNYQGNNQSLKIQTDTHHIQTYSINGQDLFLGYDQDIKHKVGLNVSKLNQTALAEIPSREEYINATHSIQDLTGTDETSYFYMSGTKPDGTTFKHTFEVSDPTNTNVSDLMEEIRLQFEEDVTVEINKNGEIMIQDRDAGNHKMSFHMVGSTEKVTNINDLVDGNSDGKIFEFVKSDVPSATLNESTATISSESAFFEKKGNIIASNIAQFDVNKKEYISLTSKLSDLASKDIIGETLEIKGTNINGDPVNAKISFALDRTEITINNTTFTSLTNGDDFTYQQLLDTLGVVMSGSYENSNDYDTMVRASQDLMDVSLTSSGKLQIQDLTTSTSKMELAIYDRTVSDFTKTDGTFLSFNSNNAIAYDEPSVDVFATLNDAIEAIEQEITHPNGNLEGFARNRGVQGALDTLTHIIDHSIKEHARTGSHYQNIELTLERNTTLATHVDITRTQVISTDVAEATMNYQQVQLTYQAMLSAVSKVNSLSLVNYI